MTRPGQSLDSDLITELSAESETKDSTHCPFLQMVKPTLKAADPQMVQDIIQDSDGEQSDHSK